MIKIKRAYEEPAKDDGMRILVDRLWPRGLSKEGARIDIWMREIAPSHSLRRWFAHDLTRWEEFKKRYSEELARKKNMLGELRALAKKDDLTLIYAAKNGEHSNAMVLKEILNT